MGKRQVKERINGEYEPYCYVIRDTHNQNMYIGSRTITSSINALQSDLGNTYFTSSKIVNPLWVADNERFEIVNIYECETNKDALLLEEFLIDSMDAVNSEQFYNQSNNGNGFSSSGYQFSHESKDKMRKKRIEYFQNMTDEQREDFSNKQSIAQVIRHNNLTEDQKKDIQEKRSKARKLFWDSASEEYKQEIFSKVSDTKKKRWKEMDDEKRQEHIKNARLGLIKHHRHRSESEKQIQSDRMSKAWEDMSEEKRNKIKKKQSLKAKNRKKILCEYCNRTFDPGNFKRYHGEKCKQK